MAVAAYGSLLSLLNVLDNVCDRAQQRLIQVDMQQIQTLQEAVNYLVEFLELHSQRKADGIEGLWRQIAEVAFEADGIFDLHTVEQLRLRLHRDKSYSGFSVFHEDLNRVIQKFNCIKKELSMMEEVMKVVPNEKCPRIFAPTTGLSAASFGGKNIVVGLDEHVHEIMERLVSNKPNLQIIPIIGMGGIGKTTLARTVYDHPYIVNYFYIRMWLTISQEYSVRDILLSLLNEGKVNDDSTNNNELGGKLYKRLCGQRYLIVMDDVWSKQAWDDLSLFFPNNRNGSRVIVTTRLSNLASSLGSHNPYALSFLDEGKSWSLLCQSIFAQEDCPYSELEEIGKAIARSCRGLPLAIAVIGRHLANPSITKEDWEIVAQDMNSFDNMGDYEHCMKVLYLSYNNLPIHLKLCSLYLRVSREDARIRVSELIRRWVAEGFIKPMNGRCLEEIGEEYIKDLFSRNLIISIPKKKRVPNS